VTTDPFAPPQSEIPPAPAKRWINTVVLVCAGLMLLDILVGVIVHYATGAFPLLPVLGVFLILSGLRLIAIAVDTVQRIRLRQAAGDADRISHGWGWVVYKSIAALVAFGGAAYVLLSPEASKLERIFG